MRKSTLFTTLLTAAVIALCSVTVSTAGIAAPIRVNVQVNGYLPAPPGVHIYLDEGRPFYFEHQQRVYVERDRRHHRDKHRHGYEYREHEDNGRHNGHGR